MATPIIDIDTSVRPFLTVQPTRYTLTDEDTVRVSVGLDLAETLGGDKFNARVGTDVVTMLDGETSDTERSAIVGRVVLNNRFVTGFEVEPTVSLVTLADGTPQYRVAFTALTDFGQIEMEF